MKFADPMMLILLAFVPVLLLAQFLKYNRFSVGECGGRGKTITEEFVQ